MLDPLERNLEWEVESARGGAGGKEKPDQHLKLGVQKVLV